MPVKSTPTTLPLPYRIFFLLIEPISALVGAYYAFFTPSLYVHLTNPSSTFSSFQSPPAGSSSSSPSAAHDSIQPPLTPELTAALTQLANLYLFFAINEALVLRSTADLKVWRTVLLGLLVADLGHLWSVSGLGIGGRVYWEFWNWNSMNWGNVGFVYLGAAMRICFLSGVGLKDSNVGKGATAKRIE